MASVNGQIQSNEAGDSLKVVSGQALLAGDTQLLPQGTRKIKRVEASNSDATVASVVGLKIPSLNSGNAFGKKYLPPAGGMAVWIFPMGYLQTENEPFSVNLSDASQIEMTVYYE